MPKIKELEEPKVAAYVERLKETTAKNTVIAAVKAAKAVTASHVESVTDKVAKRSHVEHGAAIVAALRGL